MTQFKLTQEEEQNPTTNWNRFVDFLTAPSSSITEIGKRRRAKLTSGLILFISTLSVVGALAGQTESRIFLFGAMALGIMSYLISRTKYHSFGAFLFLLSISAIPYVTILTSTDGTISERIYAWIPLALIIASVLVNRWALFLFTGLTVGATLALSIVYPEKAREIAQISGLVTTLGLLLIYLETFRANIEKLRLGELTKTNQELSQISQFLEERVEERTAQLDRKSSQLEAASMVARSAAETADIKTLLDNVVEQISNRFGFYHTGIFLSDSSRQKVYLAAASSEGGKKMLARGHNLNIGREGVVGYAAYEKRPRVAQDIDRENVYFRNPELPDTRSEAALPLLIKNQVIGVLDIQSTEQSPFGSEDLFILQTMADQIALAIQNARLLEESNSALEQLQAISAKSVQEAWRSHLGRQSQGYVYNAGTIMSIRDAKDKEPDSTSRALEIEVNLRGQKIGVISLRRGAAESDWTEKEQDFTEKIAAQIALAVENARLLEESQRRAVREQTLNELTTRLSRSLDLETLLQNAVLELHKLPQVTDASVMIAPQEPRKQG